MPPAVVAPTIVDLTTSPSTSNEEPDLLPLLRQAIYVSNEPRLRSVLIDLCKLPAVQKEVAKLLLAPAADCRVLPNPDAGSSEEDDDDDDEEEENTEESSEEPPNAAGPVAGVKRMRPRFVTCEQCDEEFDATANYKGDCVWHDGSMDEINEDFWCDHDEDCHGIIDTGDMREEYPDGFIWSCCDELGSAEGCHTTAHKFTPDSVKRRRY